jgi:hypothetical protein
MMVPSTPPAAKFLVALAVLVGVRPARAQADDRASAPDAADVAAAPADPVRPPVPPPKPAATHEPAIAPPGAHPPAVVAPAPSWLARQPLALTLGQADKQWSLTFYGIIEADYIVDSTRSYDERIASSLVARSDTFEGRHGRSQFSVRNTRFGMNLQSPASGAFRPSARL